MKASLEKWARSFFPGNSYNIMTTNIAEYMNVVLRDARSLPLISLLEAIKSLIQGWFYETRNTSAATMTPITPWLEKKLTEKLNECRRFTIIPLSMYEFEVRTFEFRMM